MASLLLVPHQRGYPVPEGLPPPALRDCPLHPQACAATWRRSSSSHCCSQALVISLRETGLLTGRHQEARTRLELLALDPRPWSSVEDLAVESLPSSSS